MFEFAITSNLSSASLTLYLVPCSRFSWPSEIAFNNRGQIRTKEVNLDLFLRYYIVKHISLSVLLKKIKAKQQYVRFYSCGPATCSMLFRLHFSPVTLWLRAWDCSFKNYNFPSLVRYDKKKRLNDIFRRKL